MIPIPKTRSTATACFVALLSVLLACPAPVRAAGVIVTGRIALPKVNFTPVMNKRYDIIASGGVLSPNPPRSVVYLLGTGTNAPSTRIEKVVQTNYAFAPSLLPIQVGTRVEFPNADPTFHNVFSYSPPKRFDLGRYLANENPIPSQLFDKPGLVTLRCDIHEHMRGLILVLDTPYFVLSDTEGNYRLENLPAGPFTLKAWLNSRTTLEKRVVLPSSGTVELNLP